MRALKVLLLSVIFLGAAGFYVFNVMVPDVNVLKTHYPAVIYHPDTKTGEVVIQKERPKSWVSVKDVAKQALGAIIVSEDWAFFQHEGYDVNQLQIVIHESWEKKKLGRGASTITQQVAKNVFLSSERSLVRKALELYLATQLEHALKKYKILEIYINIAEMGPGIYGIGPAAQYYFSKSPSQLNAKEGAFLAMLLPSPVRYSQSFRQKKMTPFAHRIVESILDKMVQAQYLTEDERASLRNYNLSFEQMPEQTPEGEAATAAEEAAAREREAEGKAAADAAKAGEEQAVNAAEEAKVPQHPSDEPHNDDNNNDSGDGAPDNQPAPADGDSNF